MVRNQTYRQGIEEPLTEEILRQLVHTEMLPASEATADAILEVEITGDRGRSLVSGSIQRPVREGSLEFLVHARILDRRTGRTLVDRHLIDRAEYRTPSVRISSRRPPSWFPIWPVRSCLPSRPRFDEGPL